MRAEELEEVGDRHVDRDGEHAELRRALLPQRVVVLEDAHLRVGRRRVGGAETAQLATWAGEIQWQRRGLGSACTHMPLEFLYRRIPGIKRYCVAFQRNFVHGFIKCRLVEWRHIELEGK